MLHAMPQSNPCCIAPLIQLCAGMCRSNGIHHAGLPGRWRPWERLWPPLSPHRRAACTRLRRPRWHGGMRSGCLCCRGILHSSSLQASNPMGFHACRSAAKVAGLEPATAPGEPALPRGVHPAAAAALAWRHAQLLSALPRRETEAAAWAHTGRALLDATPSGFGDDIEDAFGGLQVRMGRSTLLA